MYWPNVLSEMVSDKLPLEREVTPVRVALRDAPRGNPLKCNVSDSCWLNSLLCARCSLLNAISTDTFLVGQAVICQIGSKATGLTACNRERQQQCVNNRFAWKLWKANWKKPLTVQQLYLYWIALIKMITNIVLNIKEESKLLVITTNECTLMCSHFWQSHFVKGISYTISILF